MKVAGIIPARYGSTRFPGKPLALIQGKPMIQWVYENALQCEAISELWVATDHEDIRQTVLNFGGKVIMTLEEHPSGTDRCLEAYIKSESDADVVINIQGDEPFIKPEMLQSVAHQFEKSHVDIATLVKKVEDVETLLDPNKVKVVLATDGKVLYFSRSPIPFCRGEMAHEWLRCQTYYKHIGIYGYRVSTLREICHMEPSALEQCESLEQLRWLENGKSVYAAITKFETPSVDSPEDLKRIEETHFL
ncbi:MAG: 3-deoxy-manno-octulosonate cytidylyltransferase [Flavobacteriales bacterium]|nr:3-deoxy-manno-octulosonate cytidylyltransferase [Flavobacteriales bacterium]